MCVELQVRGDSKVLRGKGRVGSPPKTLLRVTYLHFVCVGYEPSLKMLQVFFLVCLMSFNFGNGRVLLIK